jgi:Tfp pilus assembly pilus retraction ATPase PilT
MSHAFVLNKLLEEKLISEHQLNLSYSEVKDEAFLISHIQKLYGISDWTITRIRAEEFGCAFKEWTLKDVDKGLYSQEVSLLKQSGIAPLLKKESTFIFAASHKNFVPLSSIQKVFSECTKAEFFLVPELFIHQCYGLCPIEPLELDSSLKRLCSWENGKESLDSSATQTIIELITKDAIYQSVSDIHFEPKSDLVNIRFRIHGFLKDYKTLALPYWPYISNRLKVLASMNTSETRRPQNGHYRTLVHGHTIDIRVSSHPTLFGESIVLRLLDQDKVVLPLEELGFSQQILDVFQKMYAKPHGIILFTGPTGAGKTTTLYSILNKIKSNHLNIMTLEDPVEYKIDGLRQTNIQAETITFEDGIRSILRQDPDVLLIGEIRDEITAQMAFRASQTGHLVFSTLHANNVKGIFSRLEDLGVSKTSMSQNIVGCVSQRLIPYYCSCIPEQCPHTDGIGGRIAVAEALYLPQDSNLDVSLETFSDYISLDDSISACEHEYKLDEAIVRSLRGDR